MLEIDITIGLLYGLENLMIVGFQKFPVKPVRVFKFLTERDTRDLSNYFS
jgi:hypothetical protein